MLALWVLGWLSAQPALVGPAAVLAAEMQPAETADAAPKMVEVPQKCLPRFVIDQGRADGNDVSFGTGNGGLFEYDTVVSPLVVIRPAEFRGPGGADRLMALAGEICPPAPAATSITEDLVAFRCRAPIDRRLVDRARKRYAECPNGNIVNEAFHTGFILGFSVAKVNALTEAEKAAADRAEDEQKKLRKLERRIRDVTDPRVISQRSVTSQAVARAEQLAFLLSQARRAEEDAGREYQRKLEAYLRYSG